jgi:uncharacterized protein with PIN domain
MAFDEGRVLLTSDGGFLERKLVRDEQVSLLVMPHVPVEDQLRLVARNFDLERRPSRCMECNGELAVVPPDAVAEQVPPGVIQHHERFFRCQGCVRVFWYGSHWERIHGRLQRVFG